MNLQSKYAKSLATSSVQIPAINFGNPSQSRGNLAQEIVEALENVGFLYLENVAGFDSDEIEKAAAWFYNLPSTAKHSLACKRFNRSNTNVYRGFLTPDANSPDYMEAYEVGEDLNEEQIAHLGFPLYESNQWPSGGEDAKWFRDVVSRYYKTMHAATLEFSSLIARGFGAKEDWFNGMFSPFPLSTLRFNNYPTRQKPVPASYIDGDDIVQCRAHCDSHFITFLSTFDYPGLQIEDNDGKWIDVPVRRNSLVVNIGDILSRATSYKLKATKHRVLDIGKPRKSVVFFLEPRFDVNINKVITGHGFPYEDGKDVRYGPWLVQSFKEKDYSEYIGLDLM